MIKRNNKKGFTIVELVIVIAVIAILAAVLIPTFSGIIKKAQISSDTALVKNLNMLSTSESAVNGGNKTAYDAVSTAFANGYSIENLTPTTGGYDILWDSKADRFVLVDENGAEVFPKDGKTSTNKVDLFKLYDEMPETQEYSIYLKNGFDADSVDVTVGFDAGENRKINVNYIGTAAQEVIIRTNGGELTVNNPAATVLHYGEAAVVNVEAVASESYHAFGKVQSLIVKSGRVVVEASAKVAVIDASQATAAVKIEAASADAVANIITGDNTNVTLDTNATAASATKKEVATYAELQAALDAGEKLIVLTADFTANDLIVITKDVILDAAGHTITSTATRGITVQASNVNVTIKNLTLATTTAERGIQVNSGNTGVTLHVDNCNVTATHYAINTTQDTSIDLLVTDSTITGYAAINLWGGNMNATIMGSTLIGLNNKPAGESNSFSAIVINAGIDPTVGTTHNTYNVCVEISDSTIKAITTTSNGQLYARLSDKALACRMYFTDCTFEAEGDAAGGFSVGGATNAIYVDGVAQESN